MTENMEELDEEINENNEVLPNYRAINCLKARAARTKLKTEKLLRQAEDDSYNEIYSNLKKERKKQMKLLQLSEMTQEISDIKNKLSKYIPEVKIVETPSIKYRGFFA